MQCLMCVQNEACVALMGIGHCPMIRNGCGPTGIAESVYLLPECGMHVSNW
jgi:hypothetical protein